MGLVESKLVFLGGKLEKSLARSHSPVFNSSSFCFRFSVVPFESIINCNEADCDSEIHNSLAENVPYWSRFLIFGENISQIWWKYFSWTWFDWTKNIFQLIGKYPLLGKNLQLYIVQMFWGGFDLYFTFFWRSVHAYLRYLDLYQNLIRLNGLDICVKKNLSIKMFHKLDQNIPKVNIHLIFNLIFNIQI